MKNHIVMNKLLTITLSLLLSIPSVAQESSAKFGKVSSQEVEMSTYELEPQAKALYIYEKKDVSYMSDFSILIEVYKRIKIFSKDATGLADIELSFLSDPDAGESIKGIAANTYNIVDDKVVKTPMPKKNIYTEKANDYINLIKFSLPEVREGSVIEYKYKIRAKSFSRISEFNIQHSFPVLHSLIDIRLPGFIGFTLNSRGLKPFMIDQSYSDSPFRSGNIAYPMKLISCHNDNIPSIANEPMVWCISDFIMGFDLEVNSFVLPEANIYKYYSLDWDRLNNTIAESDLGRYQKAKNPLSMGVKEIREKDITDTEKMREILNLVRKNIAFNNKVRLIPNSPSTVLHNGIGDMADINNILSLALRDCGIRNDLILLNLRSEGRLPFFPSLDKINTFIVCAYDRQGKAYYMDASDKYSDLNVLSPELCVDKARIYDPNGTGNWVNLSNLIDNYDRTIITATLNEEGKLHGHLNRIMTNQNAYIISRAYNAADSEDSFREKLESKWELTADSLSFSGLSTSKVNEYLSFTAESEYAGDYIYIKPTLIPIIDGNPFTTQDRKLPIEFSNTDNTIIQFNFTIPEGFIVEDMPSSCIYSACGGDITLSFLSTSKNGQLMTKTSLALKRLIFSTSEYPEINQLFGKLAELTSSRIVLKKTE